MARKKAEEGNGGEMQANKSAQQAPKGKPGRKPGPFWREQAQCWAAKVGGKQVAAPKTIGRSNVVGARTWYSKLLAEHVIGKRSKDRAVYDENDSLPGTVTKSGTRRLALHMTPEVAADLKELTPLVMAEHLMASDSYSHAISVAIVEALASRRAKGKGKS